MPDRSDALRPPARLAAVLAACLVAASAIAVVPDQARAQVDRTRAGVSVEAAVASR